MDTHHSLLDALGGANIIETADPIELTDRFWAAWDRRIERLVDDRETQCAHLATILGVDADRLTLAGTEPVEATYDGETLAHWPSEAAAVADIALIPLLAAWYDPWREYDDQMRLEVVARLRAFLRRCPACDQPLSQAHPQTGIECPNCEQTLLVPSDEQDRF